MNADCDSFFAGYAPFKKGKVRDIYSLGDGRHLMIVASDRISAFDHVLPTRIPGKGAVLTLMSNFWFRKTEHIVANHLVDTDPEWMDWYWGDEWLYEEMRGRVVVVKRTEPLRIKAVVRGYLSGSAWKEYRETGQVCGNPLPENLRESEKLPFPIYTPSTKEEGGVHDRNITFDDTVAVLGREIAVKVRDFSLPLYSFGAGYALDRGIIIADTKFEFGLIDGRLILIDELFTPDSSRFWPLDGYAPGGPQASFDKQYVRDYLEGIRWDKKAPAPFLPDEVVAMTAAKYNEAQSRLGIRQSMETASAIRTQPRAHVYR
jgi:phosphoribosylaminoimidazole-succinocarboxamide synthase